MSRARGVCPECGRVISGRAAGIQTLHADRRWVILQPHTRTRSQGGHAPPPPVCLPPGGYRRVPRLP